VEWSRSTRLIDEQPVTLERYLSPAYRSGEDLSNPHQTGREASSASSIQRSLGAFGVVMLFLRSARGS